MTPDGVQYEERYEHPTEGSSVEAVVTAVARANDSAPAPSPGEETGQSLDPLYEAVDPDALDALLAGADDDLQVTFTYAGCVVTLSGDGRIRVTDAD